MRTYVLVVLLLFSIPAFGQESSSSGFQQYLGYSLGFDNIKEENLIPKVHRGVAHTLSYGFELRNDCYHRFELHLSYGSIKTEIENEAVSFHGHAALSYCHGFRIIEGKNFQYFLGPKASFTSSLFEYELWDEAHAYWGNYISLGSSNVVVIKVDERKSLTLHLDFTLLGLSTRPNSYRLYANEYWTFSHIMTLMNSQYRLGGWNNALQVNASAEYRTPIFQSSSLAFSFSFFSSRIKAKEGKPLKELIPKLGVRVWL